MFITNMANDNTEQKPIRAQFLWTTDNVLKLIELYRTHPILWDFNLKDYKNKHQKNHAWEQIGNVFGVDKSEVIRKMNIVLTQFRRERSKCLKRCSDVNADPTIVDDNGEPSKWFAFKHLIFLLQDNKSRYFQNIPSGIEYNLQELNDTTPPERDMFKTEIRVPQSTFEEDDTTVKRKPKRKKPPVEETMSNHPTTTTTVVVGESLDRDEYTIFAENVACKLRKLRNDKLRCLVQYKINTILFEAEMSSYNESGEGYLFSRSTGRTSVEGVQHCDIDDEEEESSDSSGECVNIKQEVNCDEN